MDKDSSVVKTWFSFVFALLLLLAVGVGLYAISSSQGSAGAITIEFEENPTANGTSQVTATLVDNSLGGSVEFIASQDGDRENDVLVQQGESVTIGERINLRQGAVIRVISTKYGEDAIITYTVTGSQNTVVKSYTPPANASTPPQ